MTHSIDVSVTVSQTLRDLLGGRTPDAAPGGVEDPVDETQAKGSESASAHVAPLADATTKAEATFAADASAGPTDHWPVVLLRRDGDRPARFRGQSVLSFSGPCDLGGWDCMHDVALFVAQHRQVFLGLSLHPPRGVGARPVFDCYEVSQTPLDHVLARWSTRIRDHIPVPRSVTAPAAPLIAPADVSAGFHTVTAHCFRGEHAHSERNEECLH